MDVSITKRPGHIAINSTCRGGNFFSSSSSFSSGPNESLYLCVSPSAPRNARRGNSRAMNFRGGFPYGVHARYEKHSVAKIPALPRNSYVSKPGAFRNAK